MTGVKLGNGAEVTDELPQVYEGIGDGTLIVEADDRGRAVVYASRLLPPPDFHDGLYAWKRWKLVVTGTNLKIYRWEEKA